MTPDPNAETFSPELRKIIEELSSRYSLVLNGYMALNGYEDLRFVLERVAIQASKDAYQRAHDRFVKMIDGKPAAHGHDDLR